MKQSHLRGSAMQWWNSETVSCSSSLQFDVMTGYSMWPHHSTRQFLMKEAETVSEMLDRLIAHDFTKFVSRWQFKAYIYIFTSIWEQTLDECVLPYTSNLY